MRPVLVDVVCALFEDGERLGDGEDRDGVLAWLQDGSDVEAALCREVALATDGLREAVADDREPWTPGEPDDVLSAVSWVREVVAVHEQLAVAFDEQDGPPVAFPPRPGLDDDMRHHEHPTPSWYRGDGSADGWRRVRQALQAAQDVRAAHDAADARAKASRPRTVEDEGDIVRRVLERAAAGESLGLSAEEVGVVAAYLRNVGVRS